MPKSFKQLNLSKRVFLGYLMTAGHSKAQIAQIAWGGSIGPLLIGGLA